MDPRGECRPGPVAGPDPTLEAAPPSRPIGEPVGGVDFLVKARVFPRERG